jgi:hypothetical protein
MLQKCVLPIQHPPAVTVDGRSVEDIKREAIAEREAEGENYKDAIMDQLDRLLEQHEQRDKKRLQSLIDSGRLDPLAAALIEAPQSVQIQAGLVLAVHGPDKDETKKSFARCARPRSCCHRSRGRSLASETPGR